MNRRKGLHPDTLISSLQKNYNTKIGMSKVDKDGFKIVSSKRFSKRKFNKITLIDPKCDEKEIIIDTEKALRRIHSATEELRISKYFEDVSKSVSTFLQSQKSVELVCFGIGHIGECNISRYQLALLLCLKDLLSIEKVFIHDPIFYISECEILKKLGLEIIEENKEGNYIISDHDVTVVYLPHCPKQLTNNFLWSNWSPNLWNCVLICNSFTSLIENQPSRILLDTVPYIYKVFPHTTEILLENNFKYTDIFNDTSIHYFSKESLDKLDSEFWKKGEKPQYENTEEFITSLMVEKLKI